MEYKYIVIRVGNQEMPIIFPTHLVHALMADSMVRYFVKESAFITGSARKHRVISAGSINLDTLQCFGKSETLKLESRGVQDSRLIASFPYTSGYVED